LYITFCINISKKRKIIKLGKYNVHGFQTSDFQSQRYLVRSIPIKNKIDYNKRYLSVKGKNFCKATFPEKSKQVL